MSLHKISIIVCTIMCLAIQANAQRISGKVSDKKSQETLIGANVYFSGTTYGSETDIDGQYSIDNVPEGVYTLVVSYVSFNSDSITLVKVSKGVDLTYNFTLNDDQILLKEVQISGTASRKSVSALISLQQRSTSIVTGISNDDIKRTPDRNTSDVLKRISGASIQDNKFVVVRGLSERYNYAMLNGQPLPSTEPDKRAFSFDLFPSNMLDNLVIYKTATPDLPGEFAGGVIQLNTKEVPEESFINVSLTGIYNSQSTFKPYQSSTKSNMDWWGKDDGSRALPAGVNKENLNNPDTKFETSKLLANDWKVIDYKSMMPSLSAQVSGALHKRVFGKDLGFIGAINFSNTNKRQLNERGDFNVDTSRRIQYLDEVFTHQNTWGGLFNFAYKLNDRNSIYWNNILNQNGNDQLTSRTGLDIEQARYVKGFSSLYLGTQLYSTQLNGAHMVGDADLKLNWGLSFNQMNRSLPSYRRITYFKNVDDEFEAPYYAFIPLGTPSPNYAGRFYSDLSENKYAGTVDLGGNYRLFNEKGNKWKIGAFGDMKTRTFDAQVFGYTQATTGSQYNNLKKLPIDSIFLPENIGPKGFVVKESTNPSDSYDASSALYGGYAMVEQLIGTRIKAVFGVRVEGYNQKVKSTEYGGKPINIDSSYVTPLPSLNLTYKLTSNSNLRFSASRTLIRPNFRELAPFSFYDYERGAAINGNPDLLPTNVTNLDLRYEIFPGTGRVFSVTGFYKKFKNPVEELYETLGVGTVNLNYGNAPEATNFGAEIEFRYQLDKFANWLRNFTFLANGALIHSKVDLTMFAGNRERPMQGQSPYLLNTGLSYYNAEKAFGATVSFNRVGRRIWFVGTDQILDSYENPRNVLDFQVSAKLFKKLELRVNASDLFNNEAIFYQDQNSNKKFDAGTDTKVLGSTFGSNYSMSLSYTF
ncbi:MAG: TonB-dependent receptor [Saprospiraceae bacterium]